MCKLVGIFLYGMIFVVLDVLYENVELFVASEGVVVGERVRFGEFDEL